MVETENQKPGHPDTIKMRHGGAVTIPQEVRTALGLEVGDRFFVQVKDGTVVLVPIAGDRANNSD